jgi:hypothetical protein
MSALGRQTAEPERLAADMPTVVPSIITAAIDASGGIDAAATAAGTTVANLHTFFDGDLLASARFWSNRWHPPTQARNGQVREHLAGAWHRLATGPAPAASSGQVATLANRILTYTNADTMPWLLEHLDADHGGLVLVGGRAPRRLRLLEQAGLRLHRAARPGRFQELRSPHG